MVFGRNARFAAPALINGTVGIVVAPHGHLLLALSLTIEGDQITGYELIGDPTRLRHLTWPSWRRDRAPRGGANLAGPQTLHRERDRVGDDVAEIGVPGRIEGAAAGDEAELRAGSGTVDSRGGEAGLQVAADHGDLEYHQAAVGAPDVDAVPGRSAASR